MRTTLIILLVLFLSACGDEDENPTEPTSSDDARNFLPLSEGNWWKYSTYAYDSDGNPLSAPYALDSIFYHSSEQIMGKEAHKLVRHTDNQGDFEQDTMIFATNGNEIFIWDFPVPLDDDLTYNYNEWTKIYDDKKGFWEMSAALVEVDLLNEASYNGSIKLSGFRWGNSKGELGGKILDLVGTRLLIHIDVNKTFNDDTTKIQYVDTLEYIFAKDVGIMSFNSLPNSEYPAAPSYLRSLQKYNIE